MEIIEALPLYPSGLQLFYKFIADNFDPPTNVFGKIVVTFIVEKNGELNDFNIIQDTDITTAKKLIELLKKSPKWTPGMQGGKPVRAMYTLPVTIPKNN